MAVTSCLPQAMESSRMRSGVMAETKRKQAMLTFWDSAKKPCSAEPSNHCRSQRSAESMKKALDILSAVKAMCMLETAIKSWKELD